MANTNLGTITIVMDDSLITAYRIDNQELKRKLAIAEQYMAHNTVLLARALKAERMVERAERAEAKCDEIASELADLESAKGELFDEAQSILKRADRAEAMVERLIESGKPIAQYLEHADYRADTFIETVAEWRARNE